MKLDTDKPLITIIAIFIFTGLLYYISFVQALKVKEMADKGCKQYQIQIIRPIMDPFLKCLEY